MFAKSIRIPRYTWLVEDIINTVTVGYTETSVFRKLHLVDLKVLQILEMFYDSVITTVKFYKGTLKNVQMFPRQCDGK